MKVEPRVTTESNIVLRRQAAYAPSTMPTTNASTWVTPIEHDASTAGALAITSVTGKGK